MLKVCKNRHVLNYDETKQNALFVSMLYADELSNRHTSGHTMFSALNGVETNNVGDPNRYRRSFSSFPVAYIAKFL